MARITTAQLRQMVLEEDLADLCCPACGSKDMSFAFDVTLKAKLDGTVSFLSVGGLGSMSRTSLGCDNPECDAEAYIDFVDMPEDVQEALMMIHVDQTIKLGT